MIPLNTSITIIKNSRVSFLINYTITLLAASFLLITAFVAIQAQDASSIMGTRRIPLANGFVSTSDSKSKSASPLTIQQRALSSVNNPVKQLSEEKGADNDQEQPEHNVARSTDSDETSMERLKSTSSVALTLDTGIRQTRATTRKHTTSTSPGQDTETTTSATTIQPVSSISPAIDNPSTEVESDDVEKDLMRKNKKKKLEVEEEEEESDEEAERERARRKKLKLARKNSTITIAPDVETSTSQPIGAGVAKVATSKQTPQVMTSTIASSGDTEISSPSPKITTTARKHKTPESVTATSPTIRQRTHHHHKHIAEDDDLETKDATKRPSLDFSKIKLIGANHSIDGLSTMISNESPEISTLPTVLVSTPQTTNASTSWVLSKNPMSAELFTLPNISKSFNDTNSTKHGGLDSRSPVSQSSSIGKRLTTIIADTRNKLMKQSINQPSTKAASQFAYSKPYSTTTMVTPLMPTTEGVYVQVINQSDPSQAFRFENATEHLDWSKLVKVVFKSAKDNHTVYTVVMNSSELSNHPINDWSNELPKLLKNDFEKLISKWSNVFPVDHLMRDLGTIFIEKVSVRSNISTPTHIIAKLNESLAINHPSNLTTSIVQKSSDKNKAPFPSNFISSNLIQGNQLAAHFNATNNTSSDPSSSILQKPLNDILLHKNNTKSHFEIKTSNPEDFKFNSSSNMTLSTPKPTDQAKLTTPWSSSSRDHSNHLSTDGQKQIIAPSSPHVERANSTVTRNHPSNTTVLQNLASNSTSVDDANKGNRSLIEIMNNMNEEHSRLENNVKEQGDSLRHFIVICSLAVVVATSLIVALIVLLMR